MVFTSSLNKQPVPWNKNNRIDAGKSTDSHDPISARTSPIPRPVRGNQQVTVDGDDLVIGILV
jgi:hypothetical protein